MSTRQIFVNIGLVIVLIVLGTLFYQGGKSYDILLENLPYQVDGEEQPGLEAIYAYIDGGKQIFMLEGDQTMASGAGKSHVLKIELLDEEDNVMETKEIAFSMSDLGQAATINVARSYREGSIHP